MRDEMWGRRRAGRRKSKKRKRVAGEMRTLEDAREAWERWEGEKAKSMGRISNISTKHFMQNRSQVKQQAGNQPTNQPTKQPSERTSGRSAVIANCWRKIVEEVRSRRRTFPHRGRKNFNRRRFSASRFTRSLREHVSAGTVLYFHAWVIF